MVTDSSCRPSSSRSIATSLREIAPDERLAAGQPHITDAHRGEEPDQPRDLLEAQDLGALEPRQALGGHAVLAAEVAAVGDRHPQIPDQAAVAILKWLCTHLTGYPGRARGTNAAPPPRRCVRSVIHRRAGRSRPCRGARLGGPAGAQHRLAGEPAPLGDPLGGRVAGRRQQLDPLEPELLKAPCADHSDRAGGVARAAGARRQPVADLAAQLVPVDASARSSRAARPSLARRRSRTVRDPRRAARVVAREHGTRGHRSRRRAAGPASSARSRGPGRSADQRAEVGARATGAARSVRRRAGAAGQHDRAGDRLTARARASRRARRSSAATSAATSSAGSWPSSQRSAAAPAAERAQPALPVLGGEVGERVRAPAGAAGAAARSSARLVRVERVDQLVDPASAARPRRPRSPGSRRSPSERSAARRSPSARCATGAEIGLGHDEHVGDLHDPRLQELQHVARARLDRRPPSSSATSATSVSDWPTPTVSITTTSNAAASASAAARVAGARPPSRSPAAVERMNTRSSSGVALDPRPVAEQRAARSARAGIDREHRDRPIGAPARPLPAATAATTCRRPAGR